MPVGMRNRIMTRVLVMLVVDVLVFMLDGLMQMLMMMPFGQMQPDAPPHEQCRCNEACRNWFVQKRYGEERTGEGCGGKIRARPCNAYVAKRHDE